MTGKNIMIYNYIILLWHREDYGLGGGQQSSQEGQKDNGESFKFALTIFIAFLTISNRIYNYIQNNPLEKTIVNYFGLLPPFLVILLLGLYIVIKGISLETSNLEIKKRLDKFSSEIYLYAFYSIILYCGVTLCGVLFSFLYTNVFLSIDEEVRTYINILLFILIWGYFLMTSMKNFHFEKNLFKRKYIKMRRKSVLYFLNIILVGVGLIYMWTSDKEITTFIIIFSPVFQIVIHSLYKILGMSFGEEFEKKIPKKVISGASLILMVGFLLAPYVLMGDIKVQINDTYSKQNKCIPVTVTNTGIIQDINMNLSKAEFENNLTLIDSIELIPTHNSSEVISSKFLCGNSLSYGKYKIFINTTNLREGYYELSVSSAVKYGNFYRMTKSEINSFYII